MPFRNHALALLLASFLPSLSANEAVDPSTLHGKVMCGYQGWFNAQGDGAGRGYHHWVRGRDKPAPGNITFDLWPDLSEFPESERFPTAFAHEDGRVAEVFSSYREPTVLRHFAWMKEHGIDGIFLQRFASTLRDPRSLRHNDAVLRHCRKGARLHGRTLALMYDTSGLRPGNAELLVKDWKRLVRDEKLLEDPRYLRHRGKPVLALWGCGFSDNANRPSLEDWRAILRFLRSDAAAGNVAIMLGIPTHWRDLHRDALSDPALHDILRTADILSPWTVGRYRDPAAAERHSRKVVKPDIAWCDKHRLDYLPVAFPGFSWRNLEKRRGRDAPLNQIPRLGGKFFWSQAEAFHEAGARMLYIAMFDEVDEATAIFKCSSTPPKGAQFVTYDGLPSDHYLKLAGKAAQLYRSRR